MDGAQFAKMLSDKHLFELNRMEYKYSTVSVKEFAELLRQNFAQPLPLTDFSGNKLFYLPNLAQISTNGMKQLLSVPVSGQNFGLSAMTEEIYATFQIESIRSTRSSIRYILDGYAPRDEQEARIYGMKRGLEFIANRQNTITEENLHHLYQISTGDYLPDEDRLLPNHFYRHGEVFIVGGEEPRPGLPAERLPGAKYPDGTEIEAEYYRYAPESLGEDWIKAIGTYYSFVIRDRIIPKGWRIPTEAEWNYLFSEAGKNGGYNVLKDPVYYYKDPTGQEHLNEWGLSFTSAGTWNLDRNAIELAQEKFYFMAADLGDPATWNDPWRALIHDNSETLWVSWAKGTVMRYIYAE